MIGLLICALVGALAVPFMYLAWTGASLTVGRFVIGGSSGALGSTIINGYNDTYVWLERGMDGANLYATLFLVGMVAFCGVLAVNLLMTGGRSGVQ